MRWKSALSLLLACVPLLACGCQSLQPFAQRTREKIVSAREWANGGLEAFQCGKLEQAKALFTRSTLQRPDDFRVRANLARTLHQSGETSEAIAQMQQAIEQSGGDPNMLVELGEMYLDAGQLSPANRQAQAAIQINHRNANAWRLKGKVSLARGDNAIALSEFQKAAGFAPEALDIQMDIAATYRAMNQPLKALAAVESLLSRHPVDTQPEAAILAKADLLLELKQHSSAIAMLQRASREQTNSQAILIRLGTAEVEAGELSQARSTIARGIELFGKTSDLLQLTAVVERQAAESDRLVIR